jgi:MerR family transcriptional regulator/heat shock protein HspR
VADLGKLNDADYPAFPTGQAAEMVGVQQAFLRSLDSAGIVTPDRSGGGHRRYSRQQLELVMRLREELDKGHSLAAAAHIIRLEDELAAAHVEINGLRGRLDAEGDRGRVG